MNTPNIDRMVRLAKMHGFKDAAKTISIQQVEHEDSRGLKFRAQGCEAFEMDRDTLLHELKSILTPGLIDRLIEVARRQ